MSSYRSHHSLALVALGCGLLSSLGCGGAATTAAVRDATRPHDGTMAEVRAAVVKPLAKITVTPAANQPVTAAQLLAWADRNAPALIVARSRLKVAGAGVEAAEDLAVPNNPSLSVGVGGRTVGGVSRFEFRVGIQQRFEIAGERSTRIEAAARNRDAKLAGADVVRWELHALVHGLYYQLLVREQRVIAAERLAAFTTELGELIGKRVDAGESSPLDTMVAKAEVAKVKQLAIVARQARTTTALRLAELVGWPAGLTITAAGALGPPRKVAAPATLTAAALEKHPSKRWLELEVRAAHAAIEREDREAWPEPQLGVAYGREDEAGGALAHVWQATLSVPIPIFQRNQIARQKMRAKREVATARQVAFERALSARIAASANQVTAAAERIQVFSKEIIPAFEENLKKLRRAFELGEIGVLELSQIQQRILLTQRSALAAQEDYFKALATLEALSGVEVLNAPETL